MPNETRKWLYDELTSKGYDLGSYDEYDKSFDDDENVKWFFDTAVENGYDMGGYDEFVGAVRPSARKEEEFVPGSVPDEPDMRPLNEKARKSAEKEQKRVEKEDEKARKAARKAAERSSADARRDHAAMSPQERAKAFNEQFRNRQQEYARRNPEEWEVEKQLIKENDQLAKEDLAAQKAEREEAERYGDRYGENTAYIGRLYDDILADNEALSREIDAYNRTGEGDYASLKERERELRTRMDGFRNSPEMARYNDLTARYKAAKADLDASDTPENRLALSSAAAELARDPIARVNMGDEVPSLSQVDFDENRAEAEYLESTMDSVDRAKRKEYKDRLKVLNREVLDNDYYQADVARRIAENDAEKERVYSRMTEIRDRVLNEKSKMETLDDALLAEPEYQKLRLAANQLEQSGRKLAHIRDKNAGDFWVNFMDVFADPNTYNFGITNLETALAAKAATISQDKDYLAPSSAGDEDILSAVVGANEVSAEEGKHVVGKGKYGQIAAQSIPFMFQIGLTGGFGNVANAVSGRVTKALGDKFLTRATGAVLGDLTAGFFAANTIGGAKTMTDILNNYYGTLTRDENGDYSYKEGMGLGKAVWKGEVGNIIEFASERAGDHMQHLLGRAILTKGKGFVSSGAAKAAFMEGKVGNVSLTRETLADMMGVTLKEFGFRSANKAGANWAQKAMSGFFRTLDKMGVQGFPFEVAEEYVGLLGNVILGGEEKWMDFSSLGDKETHTDIWGGMLYSIGLTQAGAATLGAGGAAYNGIQKARTYHALETALASGDEYARELLGDEWDAIKGSIDGADNKGLAKKVAEYMDDQRYDPQQREAILDYVKNTYLYRGFNAGTIAQARERLTDPEGLLSLNINAEVASAQDQISDAYMLGYKLSTGADEAIETIDGTRRHRRMAADALDQYNEISAAVERQKERFMGHVGGMPNEEFAWKVFNSEKADQEHRDSALDYLMALAVEEGFKDAEKSREVREKSRLQGRLERQLGGKFYYVDGIGDSVVETSHTPNPATKQWENIFILSGNPNESGEVPFVSAQTGRRGYVKREQLADYDGEGNLVQGLTNVKGLNQFLDEQYAYERTRAEADAALQDAEQAEAREAAEAEQANADNRAIVEGRVAEDGSFTYNGKRGRLIRPGDEGAVFEPEDGSDNVALTWEELAQGSEEVTDEEPFEEPEPEPAPQPGPNPPSPAPSPAEAEEEEEEEEKPKIPLDKDGNPIYDAPGVSVEDALAEMYDTEGLTDEQARRYEEKVDQYIIDRANAAEKARDVKQGKMSLPELKKAIVEANRVADFWAEMKEYADENKAAREKEAKEAAEREALIKQYGVDTSKFDLAPQTAAEAVAEYLGESEKLINLDDAIRETLGKRKDNRVPTELFRHLGAHGILTKKGGMSIADVARDIVGQYEGSVAVSEDDVRDAVIDFLTNNTKREIRDYIFNERLRQAKEDAEAAEAEAERLRLLEEEYGPVVSTFDTKGGTVEVRVKTTEKDGVKTTKVNAVRNGNGVTTNDPRATIPVPDGLVPADIPEGAEILGATEIREAKDGRKGATLLVKLEDGTYDRLETKLVTPEEEKPGGNPPAAPAGEKPEGEGKKGGNNGGNAGNNGGNSVPLGEGKPEGQAKPEGPAAPAAPASPAVPASAGEIKDVNGARAFFEAKYGKGSKADTAVRVWELGHKTKKAAAPEDNGPISKMAAVGTASGNPLSDEEVKELKLSAIEFAVDFVNDGAVKFPDFFKTMVETFGDNLRHYAKFLYNGTKMEVSDDVRKQMDSDDKVYNFDENIDLNDIGNDEDAQLRDTGGTAGTGTPGEGTEGNGGEAPGAGAGQGNPGEDNPSEPVGGNGEGTEGGDNGVEPGGPAEGGEVVAGETGEGTDEPNRGGRGRGRESGGGRGGRGGRRGTRKQSGESKPGEENGEGEPETGEEGTDVPVSGGENTERKPGLTPEEQYTQTEQKAFEDESERLKDEEDTDKLKSLKNKLQEKIDAIKEKFDLTKAKLSGQLRAVLARLKDVFSTSAKKAAQLAQEKIPYKSVADETGAHDIGNTVVPSGAGDAMRNAIKRVEKAVGKPIAEFVREELSYKSTDDMFDGLSSEQVDALGLAIYQMKTGRMFIVGDMTGVGKGRTAAGLIRWGLLHGKKVLFATQSPDLFSSMYEDLEDIGSKGLVPWIVNEDSKANIQRVDENDVSHVIVKHPGEDAAQALYTSGKDKLPIVKRDSKNNGKRYQFVMTTYSQLYAGAEEKEGDSEKVKKLNQRQEWGRLKAQWLKLYAKDAIVIMDESHNASGDSSRGNVFRDMVADAAGVTFLSATYAKRPQNMAIYALRSSMGDAMVSQAQMLQAIVDYGVPMQEMLASALFETGEMVRRERDATGMHTHWLKPEDIYSEDELKRSRQMFDRTVEMVNKVIAFQRAYVNPIVKKLNDDVSGRNMSQIMGMLSGVTTDAYTEKYASTQYSSQVSRLTRAVMLAIKAKKAAELAVQQIKDGNKPVIAIDQTLETELKQLKKELGQDENADMAPDFGRILQKAIDFSLRYQKSTDHYKRVWNEKKQDYVPKKLPADRQVEKYSTIESYFDDEANAALANLREEVESYGKEMLDMDLTLSPIDQMRRHITDAGYKVEEITGRKSRFVKNEDGKWTIEPMKVDKPRFRNRFNGGKARNPLPEEERLDCLIINRSGATGTNLHSSKAFGDQKPRKMIIVEPAQNVDEEVQVRGRIDRTGQVHRGEYFYLVSPIPIETRFLMNLRRKLASLDASAVGTDKVSTNRVDVEDMENKYGDEVAKDFLSEHEEINDQMDKPIVQDRKTKKWIGRDNLMSDLLKAIQRMTCAEQEVTLQEIGEMYADKMEYLTQNGINDMTSVTMDLEAETIDKAVIVKGKNNKSVSVFAHDTTIERVEVNNLAKPFLSADIEAYLKSIGAMTEDGKIDTDYGERISTRAEEAKNEILAEKRRKYDEALADYEAQIKETFPQPDDMGDEEYENEVRAKVDAKRLTLENAYANDQKRLNSQRSYVGYASRYLKPGRPYLVPLNESKDAETRYGRFLGFEAGKDGRASSVKAVFAVRDSRGIVSFPVAAMHEIIEKMVNSSSGMFGDLFGKKDSDYASREEQMAEWNTWWDRMTPKSNRMHRFMITGNILQAIGSLTGHRGAIVTFTRRDKETGEISIERGLLLAEDFDPDTFMVRTRVTKEDVWDAAGELADDLTRITVYRDGNNMVVKYKRKDKDEKLSASPLLKDKELNELCENAFEPRGVDELQAVVPEKNVQKVLDLLYDNYNFTIGTLLVMPDSTDKPDRIVYTNKPYLDVIGEIGPNFPRVHDEDDAEKEVKNLMAQYKRDVTNEQIKERIRSLVQLRQAYIRASRAGINDENLAWQAIIAMSQYNKYAKPVPGETPEQAKRRKDEMREYYNLAEAYKEELLSRGAKKGTALHFKQGKIELSEIEKTFKSLNSDKEVAKIAEKVFAIAKKIPRFEIFMNERTDTEVGGYTAGEAMSFNWNFMNEEIIPDQMKASTIVHELIHTATVYVYRLAIDLNNDVILQAGISDVMNELQSIFSSIRNNDAFRHQFGRYSWNTYSDYGITNTKEMLSEAGANPKFRDLLKKVTLAVNARSGMITFSDVTGKDYSGKTQTAFDAIMERLDIILDSFDLNAFNQAWAGTGYGGQSQYFRRAEDLRNPIDRAKALATIDGIAKKLGVKFTQDSSLKAKGKFDPKTGEIRINIDAHKDTDDLEATLLHEAVAHLGLRRLFGKDWRELRSKLYEQASPEIKAKVDAIAKADGLSTEVAMEEYIASLAEDGRFDNDEETFWQKVVTALKRLLAKIGVNAGYFTDEDFRAMLYASYRNFQTGGALETAARVATAAALRRNADASHEEDEGPDDGGSGGEKRRIREKAIADGTFMKAPNGKPTNLTEDQWLTVRTKAFKDWFGDWENDPKKASKVVDENGEPLVVYRVGQTKGYSVFDENRGGNWRGFYFTNRDAALKNYATAKTTESQVRAFFVKSVNPFTESNFNVLQGDKGELVDMGHDGMIYAPEGIDARNFEVKVFNSNQIKSATDNNGEFDANDPDIYHRFIGERGARRLDIESPIRTRMEKVEVPAKTAIGRFFGLKRTKNIETAITRVGNLEVAREMDATGVDPLRIKISTGWEKGRDGEWRFEEPDVRLDPEFVKAVQSGEKFKTDAERELQRLLDEDNAAETALDEYIDSLAEKYKSKVNRGMLTADERAKWNELEERYREAHGAVEKAEGMQEYIDKEVNGELDKEFRERRRTQTFPISDVLVHDASFDRLMTEYPDLADIQVSFFNDSLFDIFGATRGYYNPKTKKLMLNPQGVLFGKNPTADELTSVVLHELQHVIQSFEGFASGGNTSVVDKYGNVAEIKGRIEKAANKVDGILSADEEWSALKAESDRVRTEETDEYKAYKAERDLRRKKYEDDMDRYDEAFDNAWNEFNKKSRELGNRLIKGDISRAEYMKAENELEREREGKIPAPPSIPEYIPYTGKYLKYGPEDIIAADKRLSEREKAIESESEELRDARKELSKAKSDLEDERYRLYKAIAGEVEARNVQTRMSLSDDERYNSLAESTEDVDRAEQIIIDDNGMSAAVSYDLENPADNDGFNDLPDGSYGEEEEALYRRNRGYAMAQTADDMYDRRTSTVGSALYASQVDEYAPADALQESIYREMYGEKKKLPEKDRLSNRLRELGGQAMHETRRYVDEYMKPMWDAVAAFRKKVRGADGKKMSQKDMVRYVGLKSGLERNVLFAKRDAKRDYQKEYDARIEELKRRLKEGKAKLDRQLQDGEISDVTYNAKLTALNNDVNTKMAEAETKRQARFAEVDLGDAGNDKKYKEYRKKDYSALMTWFNVGNDLKRRDFPSRKAYNRAVLALSGQYVAGVTDLASAEDAARRIVDDAERRAGRDVTGELWRTINAATKETLDFQYEHNMISSQQRSDIAASMRYYVPMRGFEDNTAEDLYSYYMKPNNAGFAPTILAAKGRTTRYDNPFGMIGFMHSSAVSQGLKNEAKLTLLDFVRKYPKNTLATITRAWFVQTGELDADGNPVYEVAYPDIPEGATAREREAAVKAFEEEMARKKENGEAYNSHREVRMNGGVVAFEREAHKNEHVVKVVEGGKEYGIIVNGNPAAAQAINGIKRQGGYENFLEILRVTRRTLSAMFTTLSVPFWVSNFQRDQGEGLATTFTRNNLGYTGGYILNRLKILPQMLPLVMGGAEKGGKMDKLSPELANYYRLYVENGGPMGQNRIENDSQFVRQMNRYIALRSFDKAYIAKGADAVFRTIASLGEAVETITRFSTFVTSMEYGRSLHEAISDSKEVSTNFARKGHGRSISWEETGRLETRGGRQLGDNSLGWFTQARNTTDRALIVAGTAVLEILRAGIPFFNASVQGIYKKTKNYQANWVKAVLVDGVYLAMGFAMRFFGGGAGGDDDKEKYGHQSDYTRRNNLLTPRGEGRYVKWALPQEYRYMFALGDIIAEGMLKEKPMDDLAIDAYEAFAQVLPAGAVDPSAHGQAFWVDALKSVMPGAVTPIIEAFENRDFKGSRIYNEGYNGNAEFDPGWTKAIETTGPGYVKTAEWLNKVTGGGEENAAIRGKIDLNPAIVEHFVKSYLSGPYQIVGGVGGLIGKARRGEKITTRDIPVWNRLMMNANDNSRDAYYSAMYYYFKDRDKEAQRLESKMKGHETKQYDDFQHSKDYAYMLIFKQYESNERALNKMKKEAQNEGREDDVKDVENETMDIRTSIAKECLDVYFDRVDWRSWLDESNSN